MSHAATNWALKACRGKGLSNGAKWVLWNLCDRYHPDYGCFPKQEKLAEDCEQSRASVNTHLKALEGAGLLKRVNSIGAGGRQRPTRYYFPFEDGFSEVEAKSAAQSRVRKLDTEPSPEIGQGSVSKNEAVPCPETREIPCPEIGQDPCKKIPVSEPVAGETRKTPDWWPAVAENLSADYSQLERIRNIEPIQAVEYITVVHLLVPNQFILDWHQKRDTAESIAKLSEQHGNTKKVDIRVGSKSGPLYTGDGVRTVAAAT